MRRRYIVQGFYHVVGWGIFWLLSLLVGVFVMSASGLALAGHRGLAIGVLGLGLVVYTGCRRVLLGSGR